MVQANHHKTLLLHQQIFRKKSRITQQIPRVPIMHPPTLALSENPQQLKIGRQAMVPTVRQKTGTVIYPLQRQHNLHHKTLIQMQIGQSVIMLLVSFNTLNHFVSLLVELFKTILKSMNKTFRSISKKTQAMNPIKHLSSMYFLLSLS